MGIGRNFQEALQKACQSLENNKIGLGVDGKESKDVDKVLAGLQFPSWDRLFRIREALKLGVLENENPRIDANRHVVFERNTRIG